MDFNLSNLLSLDENTNVENEDKINESNKENFNISMQELLKPKLSRKSLLKSMDPLNPYSSPIISSVKTGNIIEDLNESITADKLNQSWNFMNLDNDNSMVAESVDILCRSPFNSPANEDLLCSEHNPEVSLCLSDSQNLDSSVDENDSVAVDNLLAISPMKKFVTMSAHEKLKKIYKAKQKEWQTNEQSLREEIERLQLDHQAANSILMEQNKAQIAQLTESHLATTKELVNQHEATLNKLFKDKDNLMSDLIKENEDQLEILRQENAKLLSNQQVSIHNMKAELERLRDEVKQLNSLRMVDIMIIEQHTETILAMQEKHRSENAEIINDNKELEEMLNKCLTKVNSSKSVIVTIEQNNAVLKAELSASEDQQKQLQIQLESKTAELEAVRNKCARDVSEQGAQNERQLKRKDIRIGMLENVEANLKTELQLRIRERDQLQATLMEMYTCQ